MSNIKVDSKNDWFLILILVGAIVFLMIGIDGCTISRKYTYKITFENGNYDYYELTYKVKKGSKAIEYDGETIMGVKEFELVK